MPPRTRCADGRRTGRLSGKSHPESFAIDPAISFQQVFLSPERHGDAITGEADALLEQVRADPTTDPTLLGDASLLPAEMAPTSQASISDIFGPDFADAIAKAEPGAWIGPVASAFGLHLVRVTEHLQDSVHLVKWQHGIRHRRRRARPGA